MTNTRQIKSCETTLLQTGSTWFRLSTGRVRYHLFTGAVNSPFARVELFKESPRGLVNIPVKQVTFSGRIPRLNNLLSVKRMKGAKRSHMTLEWTT